ncbi:hypothetical protein [Aneurinibacillus tyrosinisolvens]|uniref:hypothetical protein n=1 Tax=Aneurinibacillus tyrosinisolvens TaxID=1443435 RepID=UPI00063EF76E|nr:hypothetical protein [Aneurinibacillus tyrosinisolvens]
MNQVNYKIKSLYFKNTQLINNIAGTYIIKGGSLIISFFTIPAYMLYFSNQTILGLWFTIVSVLQWILTFDFGIGNGLRNKLVPALVKNDKQTIKKYVSSAYIVIGVISLCTILIGNFLIVLQNWNIILNISLEVIPNNVLKTVVILVFSGIVLQFFLQLITSILYAMQKTALSNSISLISSLLILLYVSFFKTGNIQTDLINLAMVSMLTVNIPLLGATVIVFSTKLKNARPSIRCYDKDYGFSILKLGGEFFWIQLALLFINSTNEIIITRMYGSQYVVEYQVYFRLFYLVVTLFSLIANPVWSAVTKAYTSKQFDWIVKLNRVLTMLVLFISVGNLALVGFSQSIVNVWIKGDAIKINYFYAFVFVLFSGVTMKNIASSCFANGLGLLKCQTIYYSFAAIFKIPIVILLSYFIKDWICIVLANTIVLLPYSIIQSRILDKFYKKNLITTQTTARQDK